MARGRFQEARDLARRALAGKLSADEAGMWMWIVAEAFEGEGDHEEAAGVFKSIAAQGLGRASVEALLRLARCRLEMWDAPGASRALEDLGSKDLGELSARRDELAATAAFVGGRQEEALKLLEALPEKSATAWHYLGLIAFGGGRFQRSAECFTQAIRASPGDYYNQLYLASSLLDLGKLEEARSAFEGVLKIAETPEAFQLFGRLELREERFAEAEARFRKALELSPRHAEAQFGLMTALRRQGKAEEARAAAKKFQELHLAQQEALRRAYILDQQQSAHPDDPEPAEALALHYLASSDPSAAERAAWQAVRLQPDRAGARLSLARSLAVVGRYREAAVHYRKILRMDPNHAAAQSELRDLLARHARRADGSK